MSNNQGWIQLHRKIQESELYFSEPFTKSQAWIDLLILANHAEGFFFVRGNGINVKRGFIGYSEEQLAKRWKWSRDKVRRFKEWLETRQQIRQHRNQLLSQIEIVNYDKYQPNDTTDKTTEKQQTRQQKNTNNNDNNNKNEKKLFSSNEEVTKKEKIQKEINSSLSETALKKTQVHPDEQKKSSTLPENPKQWTEEQQSAHPVNYLFRVYLYLYQERYQSKPSLTNAEYAQFGSNLKRLLEGDKIDGIDMPKLSHKELKSMFIKYFRGDDEFAQKAKHSFNLLISAEMLRKLKLQISNNN